MVDGAKDKAEVAAKSSDGQGRWVDVAKLTLPVTKKDGKVDAPALADAVADGVLGRVVEARLVKAKKVHGKDKDSYTVQILNRSPLILNGVALAGAGAGRPEVGRAGRPLRPERRPGQVRRHRRLGRDGRAARPQEGGPPPRRRPQRPLIPSADRLPLPRGPAAEGLGVRPGEKTGRRPE